MITWLIQYRHGQENETPYCNDCAERWLYDNVDYEHDGERYVWCGPTYYEREPESGEACSACGVCHA